MDLDLTEDKDRNLSPGQGSISNEHLEENARLVGASLLGSSDTPICKPIYLRQTVNPNSVFADKQSGRIAKKTRFSRHVKLRYLENKLCRVYNEILCFIPHDQKDKFENFRNELKKEPKKRQNVNFFRDSKKLIPAEKSEINGTAPHINPTAPLHEMLDNLAMLDLNGEAIAEVYE